MWQETDHGLYKQFNFADFTEAWAFMERVAELADKLDHHPRWENEWSVVQIWLITHEGGQKITEKDREMAKSIDALKVDRDNLADVKVINPVSSPSLEAKHDKVTIYTDGGSRGNPGPSACGVILLDDAGNTIVDKGVYLGITTNNQAEYMALKLALEEARKLRARELAVHMDSMLVVNQMKGIFKIKNRDLWPLHDAIKELVAGFGKVSFSHVPREFNKRADAAVNRALDDQLGIK